jgi:hypothetical protein
MALSANPSTILSWEKLPVIRAGLVKYTAVDVG